MTEKRGSEIENGPEKPVNLTRAQRFFMAIGRMVERTGWFDGKPPELTDEDFHRMDEQAGRLQKQKPMDLVHTLLLFHESEKQGDKSIFAKQSLRPRDELGLFKKAYQLPSSAWHFKGRLPDGTLGHVTAVYREGKHPIDASVRIAIQRFAHDGTHVEWHIGNDLPLTSIHKPSRISKQERVDVIAFLHRLKPRTHVPEWHEFPAVPHERWELAHNQIHSYIKSMHV